MTQIAIIGGGAAGTSSPFTCSGPKTAGPIVIVERDDRLARGVAYSTTFPEHLLNVVAANMGGIAGRREHFRDWLAAQGEAAPDWAFLPHRNKVGRDLTDLLAEASDQAPGSLTTIRAEAVGLTPVDGRIRAALADGREIDARHVVLATGTPAARDAPPGSGRVAARVTAVPGQPVGEWGRSTGSRTATTPPGGNGPHHGRRRAALVALRPGVRLVGLSRTGLLPVPHRWPEGPIALDHQPPPAGTTLRQQVRAFRAAVSAAAARRRGRARRRRLDA